MAKILVAEGGPTHFRNIKTHLENAGHKVILARNRSEAEEELRGVTPDLMIIAVNLSPSHNGGIRLAESFEQDQRLCNIPIIFLHTAYYQDEWEWISRLTASNPDRAVSCLTYPFGERGQKEVQELIQSRRT